MGVNSMNCLFKMIVLKQTSATFLKLKIFSEWLSFCRKNLEHFKTMVGSKLFEESQNIYKIELYRLRMPAIGYKKSLSLFSLMV